MSAVLRIGSWIRSFKSLARARTEAHAAIKVLGLDPVVAPRVPAWLETLDACGTVDTGRVAITLEHDVYFAYLEAPSMCQSGGRLSTHAHVGDIIATPLGPAVVYMVAE